MKGVKVLALVAVALLVVPVVVLADHTGFNAGYPSRRETIVEGHSVYAVMQVSKCITEDTHRSRNCPPGSSSSSTSQDTRVNVTVQRLGAAVAVLVRDRVKEVPPLAGPNCPGGGSGVLSLFYENPGVLWFNDQFLVGDDLDIVEVESDANVDVCAKAQEVATDFESVPWRYPCGGWVLATQAGNPDPRAVLPYWAYVESYLITDPNDHSWVVDKYAPHAAYVDLRAHDPIDRVMNRNEDRHPDADGDDDYDQDYRLVVGSSQNYQDSGPALFASLGGVNMWSVPILGHGVPDSGPQGGGCAPYDDDASRDPAYPLPTMKYNALLFFFFEDLVPNGFKDHGFGGLDGTDASWCEEHTDEWDCVGIGKTDNDEGNSHPYNSEETDDGPRHLHPTAAADLYFSAVPPPEPANRRMVLIDVPGSSAPRHAHEDGVAFDDRVKVDGCYDRDTHSEQIRYTFNGGGTYERTSWTNSTSETHRWGEGEYGTDRENTSDCTSDGYGGGRTGAYQDDEY